MWRLHLNYDQVYVIFFSFTTNFVTRCLLVSLDEYSDMRRLRETSWWILFLILLTSFTDCHPAVRHGQPGKAVEEDHGSRGAMRRRRAAGDAYWAYSGEGVSLCFPFVCPLATSQSDLLPIQRLSRITISPYLQRGALRQKSCQVFLFLLLFQCSAPPPPPSLVPSRLCCSHRLWKHHSHAFFFCIALFLQKASGLERSSSKILM